MSRAVIHKNILATIAYYDGLDYPLSAFEIWKYLTQVAISNSQSEKSKLPASPAGRQITNYKSQNQNTCSLPEILTELDEYSLKRLIEEHRGFYFLRGRKELVETRIKRNKNTAGKLKRLRRTVWFLRFIPFVRMIAVTGSLAMKNSKARSDWDLLFVLKSGRIWTGRTLVTLFLQMTGKRRYAKKSNDRICLNYYITDESLELITKDFFSAGEYFFTWPAFDTGIFSKFQLRNSWIRDFRPNYYLVEAGHLRTLKDTRATKAARSIGEKIFGWNFLENWLSDWQARKIMRNPKTSLPGSFIRANENHLVFLPEPHGRELAKKLEKSLRKLGQV